MKNLMKSVLTLILVVVMIGCASVWAREDTGKDVDDAFITSKIKDAFADEPTISTLDIKVETFKGVVQLSGTLDTAELAKKAGEIAAGVKGVKSVKNNLAAKISVK